MQAKRLVRKRPEERQCPTLLIVLRMSGQPFLEFFDRVCHRLGGRTYPPHEENHCILDNECVVPDLGVIEHDHDEVRRELDLTNFTRQMLLD